MNVIDINNQKEKHYEVLKKSLPFWESLQDSEKDAILEKTTHMSIPKGTTIHRGADECIGILILLSGELRTYMLNDEGKEVTLFRLFSNDVCLLSSSCTLKYITFDVTIDAETDTEILQIPSCLFNKIMRSNPSAETITYKMITELFSSVMWSMQQILFMSFEKRLAIFLLDESARLKTTSLIITHEQIAKYVASAREVVSRMLKTFDSEGVVKLHRGTVTILNKDKLFEKIK